MCHVRDNNTEECRTGIGICRGVFPIWLILSSVIHCIMKALTIKSRNNHIWGQQTSVFTCQALISERDQLQENIPTVKFTEQSKELVYCLKSYFYFVVLRLNQPELSCIVKLQWSQFHYIGDRGFNFSIHWRAINHIVVMSFDLWFWQSCIPIRPIRLKNLINY